MGTKKQLKVLLDTSPLTNANSLRGVGAYTRYLSEALFKNKKIFLLDQYSTEKPDITHYPFFDLFFPTLPIRKKSKTVVTIHDVIPLVFSDNYPPGKKGLLNLIRQKMSLLKNADAVITDSEASKKDIIKFLGINEKKVYVVYLAPNPNLKKSSPVMINKVAKKYKLPEKFILYVGDINYNKNIPQLIKSLKFLPKKIKLVCVGSAFVEKNIPEWKLIKTQVALSDVENRVIFINNLDKDANEDLSAIYSKATAYVQPSLYEGFGLPVLEAMQCKTAVICADSSSLTEIASKHAIMTDTRAEEIADAIKKYLKLPYKTKLDQIDKAYHYAKTFNWKKTAQKTIKVYQSII